MAFSTSFTTCGLALLGTAIIVVGDCKQIDEQLAGLGMEIEYRIADEF